MSLKRSEKLVVDRLFLGESAKGSFFRLLGPIIDGDYLDNSDKLLAAMSDRVATPMVRTRTNTSIY